MRHTRAPLRAAQIWTLRPPSGATVPDPDILSANVDDARARATARTIAGYYGQRGRTSGKGPGDRGRSTPRLLLRRLLGSLRVESSRVESLPEPNRFDLKSGWGPGSVEEG